MIIKPHSSPERNQRKPATSSRAIPAASSRNFLAWDRNLCHPLRCLIPLSSLEPRTPNSRSKPSNSSHRTLTRRRKGSLARFLGLSRMTKRTIISQIRKTQASRRSPRPPRTEPSRLANSEDVMTRAPFIPRFAFTSVSSRLALFASLLFTIPALAQEPIILDQSAGQNVLQTSDQL